MPPTGEITRKVGSTEFAYFQMGRAVGNLNVHGATLPTEVLADPKNYIVQTDGRTVFNPLAPLHELRPLLAPEASLIMRDILAVLRPLKDAIPPDQWLYFAAGYLNSAEEGGPNLEARAAFRSMTSEPTSRG